MDERKFTNLVNLNKELWKSLRIQAVKQEKNVTAVLEEAIRYYLDNLDSRNGEEKEKRNEN